VIGHDGAERRLNLSGEHLPQGLGHTFACHRRAQKRQERFVVFPDGEEACEQSPGQAAGCHGGQVRKIEIEVGGGGEQLLLAAEVAEHQGGIDADVGGDRADGRTVVALRPEPPPRRGQEVRAGLAGVPAASACHHPSICHRLLT
jgi:hypothetical protein